MTDVQAVLSALEVFNGLPDKASLEGANTWLQDFQHSPEAWTTCNVLLLSPDAPASAKIFAAQTFRSKVTYDLHQVNPEHQLALRDTLLAALQNYHAGPRTIIVQLCLAIAGLALQLPAWEDAVQNMIDTFGRNPSTVPVLLQFLTLLPEELNSNTRIPVTDDEYRERAPKLLTDNVPKVMDLLSMYIQASGVTHAIQNQVFLCLRSWLIAGEIAPGSFVDTPLFRFVFQALVSDELFDSAVDVICELIHETQEVYENLPAINTIVPKLIELEPQLSKDIDDPEKIRGYARIFSEAGETYRVLIMEQPEVFFPLVKVIGKCSAYPDLDIVPITFPFWMRLAQNLGKRSSISPLFLEAYKSLMDVIIKHLHFPADMKTFTGQEAENFRSFRHVMGDTLKDCCTVLRADNCLLAAYKVISDALGRGPDNVTWQEIEAPLFAMRSMGAEIDVLDHSAVPKIMDLIPSLPDHPRVRYAALLIIARYTEWVNAHPDYIQFQLQYISAGFEDSDPEVNAAAGQALKYLCQDCKRHLIEFLPQLHTFLNTMGSKLVQDDRRQVYEAIAYVISAMPMEPAAASLKTFALDILTQMHNVITKSVTTKQEIENVSNGLENLEIMLHVIRSFGDVLPAACHNSCGEAWTIFDNFLLKFGSNYDLAERATRVIRHGIDLFGIEGLAVASSVIGRMSQGFDATGIPSYIWISGKIAARYGDEKDSNLRTAIRGMYEHTTKKVLTLLQVKAPGEVPDVLEDYIQMLRQVLEIRPDIFFDTSVFPSAFTASMAGLTVIHSDIVFAALELFREILEHKCLTDTRTSAEHPQWATLVRSVVNDQGFNLVGYLLSGMVGDFPEDATSNLVSIFQVLALEWPTQIISWLPPVLHQLPMAAAPNEAKSQLLTDMTAAINGRHIDKVRYAILSFNRASRKARERRRIGV